MTLPMSTNEKRAKKEIVIDTLSKIQRLADTAVGCLMLSADGEDKENEFTGEYVIYAKNMALEIAEKGAVVDHFLHEILDAPLDDQP